MTTNADILRKQAERLSIALRTKTQIMDAVRNAQAANCEMSVVRLLLKHGRMTDDARAWLAKEYPHVIRSAAAM